MAKFEINEWKNTQAADCQFSKKKYNFVNGLQKMDCDNFCEKKQKNSQFLSAKKGIGGICILKAQKKRFNTIKKCSSKGGELHAKKFTKNRELKCIF